jgi:hypothetical protein
VKSMITEPLGMEYFFHLAGELMGLRRLMHEVV